MHEMALCEAVLQTIEEQAKTHCFQHVISVCLEIGDLAGVEVEAMRFGFEVVCRGTIADGAQLKIIQRPGRAFCVPCGHEVTVSQRFDACPHCGGFPLQVTGGDELRIKELEVDYHHQEQ